MSEQFKHGYALLIGVGKSAVPVYSLPVPVKDTQEIYHALINPKLCAYPKDQVRLLNDQNATRENIFKGLSWLQESAKADTEATIFIYFSGHGWLNKDNCYYLFQHDIKEVVGGQKYQIDPNSALSATGFNKELKKIDTKRLLVFLDSCHAAGIANSKNAEEIRALANIQRVAPSKDLLETLATGEGRVVFSSCKPEQYSYWFNDNSQSIYTFYFLEALKGADNKPEDTKVTISNIITHLDKKVKQTALKERGEEQTPYCSMNATNFPIAQYSNFPELTDDREIFGRDREIKRIFGILNSGSSVAIIGKAGVGKSSLLKAIAQKASQYLKKPRKSICIDLRNIQSDDDFYAALCEEVGIETCRGYQLQRNIKKHRILLLLDVIENISYDNDKYNQLRSQLRGLANDTDPPLRLVVTASQPLDILFPDSKETTSPLKNIFAEEYLQPRDEKTIETVATNVRDIPITKPIENPYITSDPVENDLFVGREDIMKQIKELPHKQSVFLYGHRRMGKTSILQNVNKYSGTDVQAVYFNLQRIASMSQGMGEIFLAIGDEISDAISLPPPDTDEFLRLPERTFGLYLKQAIKKLENKGLIIALDEFETIEELINAKQLLPSFMKVLEGLMQMNPKIAFVFAGLHTFEESTENYLQRFFDSVNCIPVSFLNKSTTRQLLANPNPYFLLTYEPEAIDRIYELTSGQPYLVQLLGYLLVNYYNEQMFEEEKPREPIFTITDVSAIIEKNELFQNRRYYFTEIWWQAGQNATGQQDILRALAKYPGGCSRALLEQLTSLDETTINNALDTLSRHDVIKTKGGYKFAVELFRRWVEENQHNI